MHIISTYELIVYLASNGMLESIYAQSTNDHFHVEMEGDDLEDIISEEDLVILNQSIYDFCYRLRDDYQRHSFDLFYYPDLNEVEFQWHREMEMALQPLQELRSYIDLENINTLFSHHLGKPIFFESFESFKDRYAITIDFEGAEGLKATSTDEVSIQERDTATGSWVEINNIELKQGLLDLLSKHFPLGRLIGLKIEGGTVQYALSAPAGIIDDAALKTEFEDGKEFHLLTSI